MYLSLTRLFSPWHTQVQKRLDGFLSFPHKLRVKSPVKTAEPTLLGTLRVSKILKPFVKQTGEW